MKFYLKDENKIYLKIGGSNDENIIFNETWADII
ncbi:hypothetical protein IGI43_003278 [Enterococcus sp. AZ126]